MGQIASCEYQIDENLTFDNQFAINDILNQREDSFWQSQLDGRFKNRRFIE